MNNKKEKY
jgi:chromosome segregation ATPase